MFKLVTRILKLFSALSSTFEHSALLFRWSNKIIFRSLSS